MTKARVFGTIGAAVALTILIVLVGPRPAAQTREPATDNGELRAQTQALRDLVAEVRALRSVIEGYTQGQMQSQTMSDLLTVQQRQVNDATTRLDAARRELEGAAANTQRLTTEIAKMEEEVRQVANVKDRVNVEAQIRQQKDELERATAQETQVRSREAELQSLVSSEQSRWSELVDRVNRTLLR